MNGLRLRAASLLAQARAAAGILHGSRAFGPPLQLNLALTDRCNLRCIHCFTNSPLLEAPQERSVRRARSGGVPAATPSHPSPARAPSPAVRPLRPPPREAGAGEAHDLLREALALGVRRLQFSGTGEIFLHPAILSLLAEAKAAGARCASNSNGTLIGPEVAGELVRMGFDDLRVTVMAGTAAGYARTHPGTSPALFDRLCGNLEHLTARRRALGARLPQLTLVCVVVTENCAELDLVARLAARVGADRVLFKPVDDLGDRGLAGVVPRGEQPAEARRGLERARTILAAAGIAHNVGSCLGVLGGGLDTAAFSRRVPCSYGWIAALVEPDGTVYPCSRCYQPLGNAFRDGFANLWYGERYRAFRAAAGRAHLEGPPAGSDCDWCLHHEANERVHRLVHPFSSRRAGPGAQARDPR